VVVCGETGVVAVAVNQQQAMRLTHKYFLQLSSRAAGCKLPETASLVSPSSRKSSKSPARPKLNRDLVRQRIVDLLAQGPPDAEALLAFAEFIHGKPFPEPVLTLPQLKAAVCGAFNCKTTTELRKSNEFNLAIAGRDFNLKTKTDWQKLYREWVGVPLAERNRTGATCINGIDVLENFRPWHVFGLEPSTATAEDIKEAFRRLAKQHHPDVGGDPRVMERLQKMRDSLLAFR
jgi:hypothetical protein